LRCVSTLLTSCPALLALELVPEGAPKSLSLPIEAGPLLADAVAADLARLIPGVQTMGLAVAAALFDQAQILRPHWPIHAELARLQQSQRGGWQPTITSFGASAGRMATPLLEPEPDLIGSPLLLLPLVLVGHSADAEQVGARMERDFEEQALAAAATVLLLQEAFSVRIEHARYLTHLDLCALTAMQYEHAGLAPIWAIIECALLSPAREERVALEPGLQLHYRGGRVAMIGDPAATKSRQAQSILSAHGLPVDLS
jgi:hypothetical protein